MNAVSKDLAKVLVDQGKFQKAEEIQQQNFAAQRKISGHGAAIKECWLVLGAVQALGRNHAGAERLKTALGLVDDTCVRDEVGQNAAEL